jgi:C4-dicarboxylate-specific signal transduction histidine kinase
MQPARGKIPMKPELKPRIDALTGNGAGLVVPFMVLAWILVYRAVRKWQSTLTDNNRCLVSQAEELAELNQSLDSKVADRTLALVRANKKLEIEVSDRKRAEVRLR